jgi:hypothetical protein
MMTATPLGSALLLERQGFRAVAELLPRTLAATEVPQFAVSVAKSGVAAVRRLLHQGYPLAHSAGELAQVVGFAEHAHLLLPDMDVLLAELQALSREPREQEGSERGVI